MTGIAIAVTGHFWDLYSFYTHSTPSGPPDFPTACASDTLSSSFLPYCRIIRKALTASVFFSVISNSSSHEFNRCSTDILLVVCIMYT